MLFSYLNYTTNNNRILDWMRGRRKSDFVNSITFVGLYSSEKTVKPKSGIHRVVHTRTYLDHFLRNRYRENSNT